MKKLIKPLPLTYGYHQFISITGKAKPSETVAAKSELSVSVILVDESKEEEMTLVLLSTLAKLVRRGQKERAGRKDVSENLISIDETKKEMTVDKREEMRKRCQ